MPDYSNGKIYTIRCRTDDNKIYVGSTIQPLYKRFGGHKKDSKRENKKHCKIYTEINDNWDNWYIELYENYPCSCKEELCKREGEIIRLIGTLNMCIAGRSQKEYQNENANKIREYQKEYQIKNVDKIKAQRKGYKKQYDIDNRDKNKEYKKQYYLKKKEENEKSILQSEEPRQI